MKRLILKLTLCLLALLEASGVTAAQHPRGLERFGSYPVHLSTGVPEITVPLYEIEAGDFTLPVSLRYHASGFRPDDPVAPVGLGWTLDAGGVINRTILGADDIKVGYGTRNQTYLRDYNNFLGAITNNSPPMGRHFISEVEKGIDSSWDTEADRFSYNFCGHSGVFRYCDSLSRFIPLNHEPLNISFYQKDYDNGYFTIADGEGNFYEFTACERTGVKSDDGGAPISGWYLTRILTPTDSITLSYHRQTIYTLGRTSYRDEIGWWSEEGMLYPRLDIVSSQTDESSLYMELCLDRIEWGDGSIIFTYGHDCSFSDYCYVDTPLQLDRLSQITVSNKSGEIRKTITLDNSHYWGFLPENKRMMLQGVTDSEEGTYAFEYNLPFVEPPHTGKFFSYTDWWGYWNDTQNRLSQGNPKKLLEKARSLLNHNTVDPIVLNEGGDRECNAQAASWGVISKILYPTGGSSLFEFEGNEAKPIYDGLEQDSVACGGLRLKSITESDNRGQSSRRSYEYSGRLVTFRPEEWMIYRSYADAEGLTQSQEAGVLERMIVV